MIIQNLNSKTGKITHTTNIIEILMFFVISLVMGDELVYEEAASGANASLTYPMQCSALRKSGFVMIKGKFITV